MHGSDGSCPQSCTAEVIRLGLGVPAIYNDQVIIPLLQNRGVSLADARDYGIVDCVEPQAIHKTESWHDAAFFNVAKVLEITLNQGKVGAMQLGPVIGDPKRWTSIEDLHDAFNKQMAFFVKYLAEADNCVDIAHAERALLNFLSPMVEDCMGQGKSLQEGGALYNFNCPQAFGVADTGDPVYAMKKFVFDEKKLSMAELKEALDANNASLDLSYADANYFCKTFKKEVGISPSQYRQQFVKSRLG